MAEDPQDIRADMHGRAERFNELMAAAPVVELVGVISPPGVGGGHARGQEFWSLSFELDGWRIVGQPMQISKMPVRKKVPEAEITIHQKLLPVYGVFRFRAQVVEDAGLPDGKPRAQMLEVIGEDSDAELHQHSGQLQMPVRFYDPELGTFTLNRDSETYDGKVIWNGQPTLFHVDQDADGSIDTSLSIVRQICKGSADWARRVGDFAVARLLELKNDNWLGADEAEVTPEGFLAKMKLQSVSVSPDGDITFWHSDGGLFWGHSIMVACTLERGPTDADIPG